MSPFVALDRDGTVIEERPYLSDPAQVRLLPNAAAGMCALRAARLELGLVTNQSGVGGGFFGLDTVSCVNERLLALLAREGVTVDAIFVCPHRPEERCACRKPGTGMLERAGLAKGNAKMTMVSASEHVTIRIRSASLRTFNSPRYDTVCCFSPGFVP